METANDSTTIVIHGIIDRIEAHEDDILVLDYKSGNVLASELSMKDLHDLNEVGKKPKAIQLLIYAWLVQQQYAGNIKAGIFTLKSQDIKLMMASLHKHDQLLDEMDSVQNFVVQIIDKMRSLTSFHHNPDSHYCTFCQ